MFIILYDLKLDYELDICCTYWLQWLLKLIIFLSLQHWIDCVDVKVKPTSVCLFVEVVSLCEGADNFLI